MSLSIIYCTTSHTNSFWTWNFFLHFNTEYVCDARRSHHEPKKRRYWASPNYNFLQKYLLFPNIANFLYSFQYSVRDTPNINVYRFYTDGCRYEGNLMVTQNMTILASYVYSC